MCDRDSLQNENKEIKSELSVIKNEYNEILLINEKLKEEIILLQSIPVQLEYDQSSLENDNNSISNNNLNNNIYECNKCIKYKSEIIQLENDLKRCKSELTNLQVENHKLITENMENKSYVIQYQDLINEMNKSVNDSIDESIKRESEEIDKDLLEEV